MTASSFRVDAERLSRAVGGLGECVEEVGNVMKSLQDGPPLGFAFGMSQEGVSAAAEYRTMQESLQDMLTGMYDLGTRHRDALESVLRLYRRVNGDATALAGLPAEGPR